MIAFTCPSCQKNLTVKDEFTGKRGSCPHCKQVVVVPAERNPGVLNAAIQPRPVAHQPDAPQAGLEDDTPSSPVVQENLKLDFLAPKKKADELGWLGRYRVLKVLGAGGMGLVLQGEDPLLKRAVALKVMRPELAANDVQRKRFLREAQATAALEHDHIVGIYEVGVAGQVPFIAMPFLKGEALDQRLKRDGKLPVAEAVRLARETAEGLAAAHERGLIHRDIKPGNIWLEAPRNRVKIMDFGLARVADKDDVHLTKSGTILGTPAYMAPEQAMSRPVDGRCDLFSLGAVFYHMLTGERPFKGHDTMSLLMALATEAPKPVRELNPAVPPAVADLVQQLLEKDPARRPASAKAVGEALAAIEQDQTQVLPPPTRSVSEGPGLRSLTLRVGVLPFRLAWWLLRIPGRSGLVIKGTLGLVMLLLLLWLFLPGAWGPADRPTPTRSVSEGPEKLFINSLGMKMVLIPKGKFLMGGAGGNVGTKEVEIPHDFYQGQYEVTQWEWVQVMGNNPSHFKDPPAAKPLSKEEMAKLTPDELRKLREKEERDKENYWKRHPVEQVSWEDCQEFIKRLNEKEKASGVASAPRGGWIYRLPTEAEWEYACRGGGGRPVLEYAFDYYLEQPTNTLLPDMANFNQSGKNRTCPIGSYKPNRLGLFDMHGNVWEWCDDVIPGDPKDPKAASLRVRRGGGCGCASGACRAAHRHTNAPSFLFIDVGLRLARVPVGSK